MEHSPRADRAAPSATRVATRGDAARSGARPGRVDGVARRRLVRLGPGRLGEQPGLPGEVGGVGELLVDTREAQVGDLIELAQAVEHLDADAFGAHDTEALGPDRIL